jgi:hypothetical protein
MESGDMIDAHLEQVRTRVTFQSHSHSQVGPIARGMVLILKCHFLCSLSSFFLFICTIWSDNEIIFRIGTSHGKTGQSHRQSY